MPYFIRQWEFAGYWRQVFQKRQQFCARTPVGFSARERGSRHACVRHILCQRTEGIAKFNGGSNRLRPRILGLGLVQIDHNCLGHCSPPRYRQCAARGKAESRRAGANLQGRSRDIGRCWPCPYNRLPLPDLNRSDHSEADRREARCRWRSLAVQVSTSTSLRTGSGRGGRKLAMGGVVSTCTRISGGSPGIGVTFPRPARLVTTPAEDRKCLRPEGSTFIGGFNFGSLWKGCQVRPHPV